MSDLATNFDERMFGAVYFTEQTDESKHAKGFTIGKRGKILYWFIAPRSSSGKYVCYGYGKRGTEDENVICYRTYVYPDQEIVVWYVDPPFIFATNKPPKP